MADTGHYDFVDNLRPVDFDRWISKGKPFDPRTLSFWLEYWIQTYSYLLDQDQDRIRFLCFERLCADPQGVLSRLGKFLEIEDQEQLLAAGDRVSPPSPHSGNEENLERSQLERAELLYEKLNDRALS